MPQGTRVARCISHVMKQGKKKGSAIAICQESTGQSYQTSKPLKKEGSIFEEIYQEAFIDELEKIGAIQKLIGKAAKQPTLKELYRTVSKLMARQAKKKAFLKRYITI